MPRTSDKDLFGHARKRRPTRLRSILNGFDRRTFDQRLARLAHLQTIFPKGYSFLLPPETSFVFDEAKMAFINGQFISTILLAQAFIEHIFQCKIAARGDTKIAEAGLAAMTKYLAKHELLHEFLVKKVDELRKIRNPFVHLQNNLSSKGVFNRIVKEQKSPEQLLEEDAQRALALMCQIATTRI